MSPPLTSAEAIARLREAPNAYRTPESLRTLAAQVDADAPGKLTVLYSGRVANDLGSERIITAMTQAGEDVRVARRRVAGHARRAYIRETKNTARTRHTRAAIPRVDCHRIPAQGAAPWLS